MASFATLKSLSDVKKYQSPYQILREFINYIMFLIRCIHFLLLK